jgi:hypothetical protein
VIKTSSGASFLKNIRAILSHQHFNSIIAYLFGLINFFPILKDQFTATFGAYRESNGGKIDIDELPSVFTHTFSQSLRRVKDLAPHLDVFLNSKFSLSLSYNDLLLPVLMLAQILFLLLI